MSHIGEREMCCSAMVEKVKQGIQEMEMAHAALTAILECIDEGVVACDQDGNITFINRAMRRIHGVTEAKLRPEEWAEHFDLFGPDGKTPLDMTEIPLYRALHGVDVTNQEVVVKPKGGKPVNLLISGRQLIDRDGARIGAVISAHDITAIKKNDEQLHQAQKFDSIGTMAGGVAHDFNNILTVIMGACTLLKIKTKSDPELEPFVRQIMNSSERAAQLTQNLLVFGRRQNLRLLPAEINEIMLAMNEILGQIVGKNVQLVTITCPVPLPVVIDREQFEQAIMYLATNASDAMPSGGELLIEVTLADSGELILGLDCRPNVSYAKIAVTDTGAGMDMVTMSRIFEPFYLKTENGRGAGLGLPMAYGIIRQHEGVITVNSEPGKGSTFSIYLPIRTTCPNEINNG